MTIMRALLVCAVVLLIAGQAALAAQNTPRIIGQDSLRVRLTTSWGDSYVGILRRISRDSIYMQPDGWSAAARVPIAGVAKLEQSLGKAQTPNRVALHGAIGVMSGLAIGVLIVRSGDAPDPPGEEGVLSITVGLGALLGALHGLFTPPERWQSVSLDNPR